ncbi:hypothetical protein LX77_00782 [Gelidibacter algens]|jgi:hypothetical protein|uniref:Anti-sigma factor n=1 Tax=Gelidibacter algens TaxID=49280 RepID=A0A1A7QPF9_9FLAO|nr:hypothetical protein [Gelidibacter algens]OBX21950.1 hypothetical protein A9996_17515 [Gelidibacter algens]RAJ26532.1 hypothetical protein LX77_00782 [Gelidibacter algens]
MKTDNIDELFKNLQNDFDLETPEDGHEERFLNKLKYENISGNKKRSLSLSYRPLLAVAAVLVLCFGLFTFLQREPEANDLASVSPQLSQTQDFFNTVITSELNKLKIKRSPENEALVADALEQMELLEKNYEQLKLDLDESGNDQRVVYAMINNFQSRIDLLEDVLKSIEDLKQLKLERKQMTL